MTEAELDVSTSLPDAPPPTPPTARVHFGESDDAASLESTGSERPSSGRRRRELEDDKVPYDIWAREVVAWEEGGFCATVSRLTPAQFVIAGRSHRTGGKCGEMHEAPLMDLIQTNWGGGTFEVEVTGPDPSRAGAVTFYGRRRCQIAADPKPIDAIGADGLPIVSSFIDRAGGGRGDRVGEAVVLQGFKAVTDQATLARQDAMRERERAEAARERIEAEKAQVARSLAPQTEMLVELAKETAAGRIDAERARAEAAERERRQVEAREARLQEELRQLQGQVSALREDSMSGSERMIASMLESVVRPALESRSNGHHEHSTDLLRDIEKRHDRELAEMRATYERQLASAIDQHRSVLEQERVNARARYDELRDAQRAEVDRVRETERNAAQFQVASLESQIKQLERREAEMREERRDLQQRVLMADRELAEERSKTARLEAELRHAPKEARDPVSQLKEIAVLRETMRTAFGEDERRGRRKDEEDEEPKETTFDKVDRVLENPVVGGMLQKLMGVFTGENEKERAKEVEIARQNAAAAKAQALADAVKLKNKQQKKLAAGTPGTSGGQRGGVFANAPSIAPPPTPVAQQPRRHSLAEADDRPLPPIPSVRELPPAVAPFKQFLLLAEQAVRNDHSPAAFLEQVQAEGVPVDALKMVHEQYPQPGFFLSFLQGNSVFVAFPVFAHPIGRRWVGQLWKAFEAL